MNISILAEEIKNGNMVLVGGVVLTKEQHIGYLEAVRAAEYYDMKQGVKKVLL